MPHSQPAWGVPQVRNAVELNLAAGPQKFLARALARRALVLRVQELGRADVTLAWEVPPSLPMAAAFPRRFAFIHEDADAARFAQALDALLAPARPLRALFAGERCSAARWKLLVERGRFDFVCCTAALAQPPAGAGLRELDAQPAASLGFTHLRFYANSAGKERFWNTLLELHADLARRLASREQAYGIEELVTCEGLYPVETDGFSRWAWTGPGPRGVLLLPGHPASCALQITLELRGAQVPLGAENVQFRLDGEPCQADFPGPRRMELRAAAAPSPCHRLEILQRRMWTPPEHTRELGLAIQAVSVRAEQ
jgi:hypothetical protein